MKDSIVFKFPLNRTHCGAPLGNGNMGALVWGGGSRLCITLNRGDLWDHRNGECVLPGQTYLELVALYDAYDVKPVQDRFVRKEIEEFRHQMWAKYNTGWSSTRLPVGGGRR